MKTRDSSGNIRERPFLGLLLKQKTYSLVMSLVASKYQGFKVGMPVFQPFYEMKLKTSNFKVLPF